MNLGLNFKFLEKQESLDDSEEEELSAQLAKLEEEDGLDVLEWPDPSLEAVESLENSEEASKHARLLDVDSSPIPDALGSEQWRMLELLEDLEEVTPSAKSGDHQEECWERYAQEEESLSSEDGRIKEELTAEPSEKATRDGLDAQEEVQLLELSEDLEEEENHALLIKEEEQDSLDASSEEDLTWEVLESLEDGELETEFAKPSKEAADDSPDALLDAEELKVDQLESGWDKVKDALLTEEEWDNGLHANGKDTGEVLELLEDSERVLTCALSGRRVQELEPSAGTWDQELSEDSLETVRDVKLDLDQVSEKLDAEVWPEEESSEDGLDKVKFALPSREESTDGLDADGVRTSEEPELSEDTTKDIWAALSGNLETSKELSAGQEEQELSEDSLETEDDALFGLKLEDNGSDAEDLWSEVKSSRNGWDKAKDALPTKEETPNGLDADGMETWEELESSEDSEGAETSALSGEEEDWPEPSAGAEKLLSSEDSLTEAEDAQSWEPQEDNGLDASDHGDSEEEADSFTEVPRSSEDTWDKVKPVLSIEEETICSIDADGLVPGEEPGLSKDITEEDSWDALSTDLEELESKFAGAEELESSRNTREVPTPALSSEEELDPGRDADMLETEEEELTLDGSDGEDGADSGSEEQELPEDSQDKDNNALNTSEDPKDSLNAAGVVPGDLLDSLEDSEEEVFPANSGWTEEQREPSAGTIDQRSLEDSEEEEDGASLLEEVQRSWPDAEEE